MKIRTLIALIIFLALTACGGGQEPASTPEVVNTPRTSEGLTADVGKGESLDVEGETNGEDAQTQVELPEDFPEDIPLVDLALISDLVTASDRVSYNAGLEYPNVSDFYKMRMPANGWTLEGEEVSSSHATYNFSKDGRTAQVDITQGGNGVPTLVVITFSTP